MSDAPIAQVDIEAEILRLSGLLEHATHEVAKRARDRAKKRTAYKVEFAKAYLVASGPIPAREAQATVATEQVLLDYETADAVTTAAMEAGRNMREQLQALRSVNANQRALVVGG